MRQKVSGEFTVFLSLVFLLLLTLVGGVLEAASVQVAKNEARADAGRAAESVFAEYYKPLLDRYGILAVEGTYESGTMSEKNILNRLSFYGAEDMDRDIEKSRYLTDQNGADFYRMAVEYERIGTGEFLVEDMLDKKLVWQHKEKEAEHLKSERTETGSEIESAISSSEEELPGDKNPLAILDHLQSIPILKLVCPRGFTVSEKSVNASELVTGRTLNTGKGEWESVTGGAAEDLLFNLYLHEFFGNAVQAKEDTQMEYELEYLIVGRHSDKENLQAIATRLNALRFAADFVYIETDASMKSSAETAGMTAASIIMQPELAPAFTHSILVAWAYAESVSDIKRLLAGESVPLVKTGDDWKLSLSRVLSGGTGTAESKGTDEEEEAAGQKKGSFDFKEQFTYDRYLQMMLLTVPKNTLSMRALDLIEQNLSHEEKGSFFRADQCLTGARFHLKSHFRRNVSYEFATEFRYQ